MRGHTDMTDWPVSAKVVYWTVVHGVGVVIYGALCVVYVLVWHFLWGFEWATAIVLAVVTLVLFCSAEAWKRRRA